MNEKESQGQACSLLQFPNARGLFNAHTSRLPTLTPDFPRCSIERALDAAAVGRLARAAPLEPVALQAGPVAAAAAAIAGVVVRRCRKKRHRGPLVALRPLVSRRLERLEAGQGFKLAPGRGHGSAPPRPQPRRLQPPRSAAGVGGTSGVGRVGGDGGRAVSGCGPCDPTLLRAGAGGGGAGKFALHEPPRGGGLAGAGVGAEAVPGPVRVDEKLAAAGVAQRWKACELSGED